MTTERILNLALLLGSRAHDSTGVSSEEIRSSIYPKGQSTAAFQKMFHRDKETLQHAGIVLETDSAGFTKLITESTFVDLASLTAAEKAMLALSGYAALSEELFPLPLALRMALTKLSGALDADSAPALRQLPTSSTVGNWDGESPAELKLTNSETGNDPSLHVEMLFRAIKSQNAVSINYVNATGTVSSRTLKPYGLYLLAGRWYLVAHDKTVGDVRVFKVSRIFSLHTTDKHFERSENFNLSQWISLPFQLSSEPQKTTTLIIPSNHKDKAGALTRGQGQLSPRDDGGLLWTIGYRDYDGLITYALEHNLQFTNLADYDYALSGLHSLVED